MTDQQNDAKGRFVDRIRYERLLDDRGTASNVDLTDGMPMPFTVCQPAGTD